MTTSDWLWIPAAVRQSPRAVRWEILAARLSGVAFAVVALTVGAQPRLMFVGSVGLTALSVGAVAVLHPPDPLARIRRSAGALLLLVGFSLIVAALLSM